MRERKIQRTKEFMRVFLTTDTFDTWLLAEAQIVCANTWAVDGHVNRDYFREEIAGEESAPATEYVPWAQIRPVTLSLIRGRRTPLSFRFTLLPPVSETGTAPDIDRLCRVRFADGAVYVASVISMKSFSLDREPERAWDEALSRILDQRGLDFEEL